MFSTKQVSTTPLEQDMTQNRSYIIHTSTYVWEIQTALGANVFSTTPYVAVPKIVRHFCFKEQVT